MHLSRGALLKSFFILSHHGPFYSRFTLAHSLYSIAWEIVWKFRIIGVKAGSSYNQVRHIIRLITGLQHVIYNDHDVGELLKVFFLPNYNLSLAEFIIPADDLSEHTSTAGMEASGTFNMKFLMNRGLIIRTMDGAMLRPKNYLFFL